MTKKHVILLNYVETWFQITVFRYFKFSTCTSAIVWSQHLRSMSYLKNDQFCAKCPNIQGQCHTYRMINFVPNVPTFKVKVTLEGEKSFLCSA